jgi:ATPase subunit of ABC transporter with duplicated ATPase domains
MENKQLPIEECDWTKKDDIIATFPRYVREQFALARTKNVSMTVDLNPFDLKTPFAESGTYLLRDTQLFLEPGKRHCLQGESGTGKSTLFHGMADCSIRDFPKHLHVHHCEEIEVTEKDHPNYNDNVLETVVKSYAFRNVLLECEKAMKTAIAAADPAGKAMEELKNNAEFIQMQLQKISSASAEERASKMLRVLGFDEAGQKKSTNSLSGGLRMRVALCAAFFIEPDLLLLDEPTNHLDFPSVLWLENRLRGYRKSFLLICHDRELLNNVCTSVVLLESKRIHYYACGFKEFEKRKAAADKKQGEEIEKFMMRNRTIDFSSPAAKEKAEKQRWLDIYIARQNLLAGKFTFPAPFPLKPSEGEVVADPSDIALIKVTDVRFQYAEGLPWIFDTPISFTCKASTRIGIMGPNGAGKSTFLKLITDKLRAVSGTVHRHRTAHVAYFAQHHIMELNLEATPMEFMIKEFPEVKNQGFLLKHLSKVGVNDVQANTRMKQLSAGMRSCIMFAKITYVCPHLLIMDEPTNFLDLDSVDALISATNKYRGALLLVSHNRSFLNQCATQFLSIVPGSFAIYDDVKTCEKATYIFIQELESGTGGGGKIGAGALEKKTAPTATAPGGAMVFGSGGSKALPPPPGAVKKPAPAPAPEAAGRGGRGGRGGQRGGAPRGGAPRGGARGGRGRG